MKLNKRILFQHIHGSSGAKYPANLVEFASGVKQSMCKSRDENAINSAVGPVEKDACIKRDNMWAIRSRLDRRTIIEQEMSLS